MFCSVMKRLAPAFLASVVLSGCATTPHAPASKLAIQIPSALGMNASTSDFRIFVDGRFVGNGTEEGTTLELAVGRHTVVVELPRGWQRYELPNGGATVKTFSLRGEEHIEILGGASQQTLVFNSDNLKSRELGDGSGH